MGKKFVTVDGNNIVQEAFDEDNTNVPNDALPITEQDMALISEPHLTFSDLKMVGGVLQLTDNAADNIKDRIIDSSSPEMIKAFAEIIMDELNALRSQHGLPDRTMAQLKTAMKNKLS